MTTLTETFSLKGKTIETVAAYSQQYLDEHWQAVWQHHLPEIEQVYKHSGDPAYGMYSRKLFRPLEDELQQAGLTPETPFASTFPPSRENWGPQGTTERPPPGVPRQRN